MEQERYRRVREIFTAALDKPLRERGAFVARACTGDEALRREVESLFAELDTSHAISLDEGPGHRLRDAVDTAPTEESAPGEALGLPESVGDYRVLRCLGEGGMGVVYEAEQQQPRRRVAVKVLRPGFASPSLITRFRLEAELLGRLQHPGIARVYEAGEGRPWGGAGPEQPFLVMEYVEGLPLTAWAAQRKLGDAERLELLAKVCDAVHHAHERGVVHRDLKPANVLVDPAGQPRVLDFGVARALDANVAMGTAHTATSQLVGTLPYMSPEQLAGHADELGPLSDVYALGVLSYELLAGRLPLPLAGLPLAEAIDRVQEVDPPSLGSLQERHQGDIEAIVSKALEKEPGRRYGSAAEMAADLRRHLQEEPIRARRQSAVYRATKFVRRNTRFVGSMVALVVVLVAGVTATTWLALREGRARREAEFLRDGALRATYRAQLGAALSALRDGQAEAAAAHLARTPEDLRDWTWRAAGARVDDSFGPMALRLGERPRLLLTPDDRLVAFGLDGLVLLRLEGGRALVERRLAGRFVGLSPDGRRALEELADGWRVHELAPGAVAPGAVGEAACLPDGSWVVVRAGVALRVGADGRFLGELPARLPIVDGSITGGPSAAWLFARDESGARLVHPHDGRTLAELGDEVRAVATGGEPETLFIARGERVESLALGVDGAAPAVVLPFVAEGVERLARAPRGPLLLAVAASREMSTWNVETGQRVASLGVIDYGVPAPSWSPDGERLLVADRTGVVTAFDATTGRRLRPLLVGNVQAAGSIAWTRDASRVATLVADGTLRVFAAPGLGEPSRLRGHRSYVHGVSFGPDGRLLVSAAWDGTFRTWDAWTGRESSLHSLAGKPGVSVRVLPGGDRAVVLHHGGLDLWSLAEGALLASHPVLRAGDLRMARSGRFVAFGSALSEAAVSELDSFGERFRVSCESAEARVAVEVAPDESSVFVACGPELRSVDSRSCETRWRIDDAGDTLLRLAVSPDGLLVVGTGRAGLISAWDAQAGRLLWRTRSAGAPVYAVAFHPSGAPLVTGSQDGVVRAWRPGEEEPLAELRCHDDYVYDLAFSPDGDLLASASADTTLCLWDAKSRAERAAIVAADAVAFERRR